MHGWEEQDDTPNPKYTLATRAGSDLDLLIAFTGGNYSDRVLFRPQREFVPEDILPAVSP